MAGENIDERQPFFPFLVPIGLVLLLHSPFTRVSRITLLSWPFAIAVGLLLATAYWMFSAEGIRANTYDVTLRFGPLGFVKRTFKPSSVRIVETRTGLRFELQTGRVRRVWFASNLDITSKSAMIRQFAALGYSTSETADAHIDDGRDDDGQHFGHG